MAKIDDEINAELKALAEESRSGTLQSTLSGVPLRRRRLKGETPEDARARFEREDDLLKERVNDPRYRGDRVVAVRYGDDGELNVDG